MIFIYSLTNTNEPCQYSLPVVTRKTTDLKEEILAKIHEKFNELKNDFLTEIKKQIKIEVTPTINN